MKRTLLLALPFAFVLSACGNADHGSIAQNDSREAVYNGKITSEGSPISRTTVLILNKFSGVLANCTGSVLSPTVILTASHCVAELDEETKLFKKVIPSNISIYDPEELSRMTHKSLDDKLQSSELAVAEKVITHPIFLKQSSDGPLYSAAATGSDIALIKLDRPLPGSFKPVILADDFLALSKNQIRVAGFGSHANDSSDSSVFGSKLREGRVKIDLAVNEFKIDNMAKEGTQLSLYTVNTPLASMIEFKKNSADASICHGDSGGPLYFEKDGEIHLIGMNVGITSNKACVDECRSSQISVSLVGPQATYVLNAYKELTGKSLDSSKGSVAQDKRTFEYQLAATTVKPKNNVVSLEGYTWNSDDEGKVMLVDEKLARDACNRGGNSNHRPKLSINMQNRSTQILDGKTIINILISNNGFPERVLEARMKMNGAKIRTVILTSEGYISADIPVFKCW